MHSRVIRRVLLGWILLLLLVALAGRVSVAATGGGRTAADFLSIGVGAGAAGMSGAYTAVCDNALAAYWNPAGLTGMVGGEAVLGHFAWFQDITLEHGTVAFKASDHTALAVSMTFLNYGRIEGYDENGVVTGDIAAYDWCGAVSVGTRLSDNFSLGVSGKLINQKLDDLSGTALAADLGIRFQTDRLTVAAAVANLGTDITLGGVSERLPMIVRIGIAGHPLHPSLLSSLELERKVYGETIIRNGLEAGIDDRYFLRTGISYYPSVTDRPLGPGITMGAGVRLAWGQIDYAFTPQEQYSSETLHRLSVSFKFGQN